MRTITVTTKTSAQIAAAFTEVCKDIQPPQATKPLTQADRLAPYRKAIMQQRVRGLTWKQIAAAMADPRIGEKVSDKLLAKVFGAKPAPPQTTPPPPTRPRVQHLILDPATGLPVKEDPPVK